MKISQFQYLRPWPLSHLGCASFSYTPYPIHQLILSALCQNRSRPFLTTSTTNSLFQSTIIYPLDYSNHLLRSLSVYCQKYSITASLGSRHSSAQILQCVPNALQWPIKSYKICLPLLIFHIILCYPTPPSLSPDILASLLFLQPGILMPQEMPLGLCTCSPLSLDCSSPT